MTSQEFADLMTARGYDVRPEPGGWRTVCPAHGGTDRNMTIRSHSEGGVICTCHSHHCSRRAIVEALGLTTTDMVSPQARSAGSKGHQGDGSNTFRGNVAPIVYPYRDEAGKVLYEIVRTVGLEGKKTFAMRLPGAERGGVGDVRRVLFGLPELLLTKPGDVVCIAEGEKCAMAVALTGLPATTNPNGAGKWRPEYTQWLSEHLPGRRFLVLADNDLEGKKHAVAVGDSLEAAGLEVYLADLGPLPAKGDVVQWLAAGGTAEKLQAMAAGRPHKKRPAKEAEDPAEGEAEGIAAEWAECERNHFLFTEGDEWCEYGDGRWSPVSASTVYASIYPWLAGTGREVKGHTIKEISFLAEAILGDGKRPFPRSRFNARRGLLPLANGMLDLETRTLLPHGPEHYNTYCLPYSYEAAATCPRFQRFLSECLLKEDGTTCEEWVETVLQWMGYCLMPDCRAETILVNVGEGGNGKSLWGKVLEALVGDVNCASIDPRQLELKPDYELASLYGKLVGFLNEPTKTQIAGCSGRIKALVSGDLVQARRPYGQCFAYRPYCRLVVSANDMPDAKDLSHGWYRRQLIIEWRFRPTTPDRRLDRTLIAELPGILNLVLDALDRLRAVDYEFGEPEESQRLKADYRRGQDTVAQFLTECCETDAKNDSLWAVPVALYKRYAVWCKDSGYQPLNLCGFGTHLTKRLGYPRTRSRTEGGKVFDVRYGIQLRPTGLSLDEYYDSPIRA